MDGDPKSVPQETPEIERPVKKRGVSRRSILNLLKGVGAGIGAAVIVGRDAIVPFARQISGVLGSPSATTTIPGNQLPPPRRILAA